MPPIRHALTLALLSLTLTLSACAPLGNRGGPPDGEGQRERGGGQSSLSGGSVMDQLQQQLQQTAQALNLTPTQTVLWDAYQERIGTLMRDQMRFPPLRSARQTALQQIDQKVDTIRNRLTAMEDIREAAGRLYATLDPAQQRIADQMLPATVPALYSGLSSAGSGSRGNEGGDTRGGRSGGSGNSGGWGGGMGGGRPGGSGGGGGGGGW